MSNILTLQQTFNTLIFNRSSLEVVSLNAQGPRGPRGLQGLTGSQGPSGLSAYQIAVNNGFVGTEQQWLDSLQPDTAVTSVNGQTGTVVLTKTTIGLGNVDNTSDANKPISTATQTALNNTQPLSTVLTNTTASFTTADKTKIDSIQSNAEVNNVFIQATAPVTSINKYMWIDTSGGDLTIWIEDGV